MLDIQKACKNCGCESLESGPHRQLYYLPEVRSYNLGDSPINIVFSDRWFYCTKCNKCCLL